MHRIRIGAPRQAHFGCFTSAAIGSQDADAARSTVLRDARMRLAAAHALLLAVHLTAAAVLALHRVIRRNQPVRRPGTAAAHERRRLRGQALGHRDEVDVRRVLVSRQVGLRGLADVQVRQDAELADLAPALRWIRRAPARLRAAPKAAGGQTL